MLLDSNIIIYSAQLEHNKLRKLIAEYTPAVSALKIQMISLGLPN
jgi:hypothetical protein